MTTLFTLRVIFIPTTTRTYSLQPHLGMKKEMFIVGAARSGRDFTLFPARMQDDIEPNCLV